MSGELAFIPRPYLRWPLWLSGLYWLGVHAGQGSLPPRAAIVAGPIWPHLVGHCGGLRLKNPVGTGPVKVNAHTTHNIQGVWQRDPSVLHDSIEAMEGQACADPSERASCDESEKFRLRSRPPLPPAPTMPVAVWTLGGTVGSSVVASGTSCALGPLGVGWGVAHLLPAFGPSRCPRWFHTGPGDAGTWRLQPGPLAYLYQCADFNVPQRGWWWGPWLGRRSQLGYRRGVRFHTCAGR